MYDDARFDIQGGRVGEIAGSYDITFDASYRGYPVLRIEWSSKAWYYLYATLQEAIAAYAEGNTVMLGCNITEEVVDVNKAFVLNLNGKTLTANMTVGAALTLSNGTVASEGVAFTLAEGATLALTDVTVTGTVLAGAVNNNVTTNSAALAAQLVAERYIVTEADGVYTVVAKLAFTAIDEALANANAAKEGVVAADKECAAGAGNKFVSEDVLNAFAQLIATVAQTRETATTQEELDAAVTELNAAIETFNAALVDGDDHKDADNDHACDYGCDEFMGVHTDSDDEGHLCDY
jgi:hypothetical protein